jgi:ferric-dicitrate binding protein FerR (iron transport regulator)
MISDDDPELRQAREAADWLMRLECEGPACHPAFTQWILESAEHVQWYLALKCMSRRLKGIDPQRKIDVDELIRLANREEDI